MTTKVFGADQVDIGPKYISRKEKNDSDLKKRTSKEEGHWFQNKWNDQTWKITIFISQSHFFIWPQTGDKEDMLFNELISMNVIEPVTYDLGITWTH